jgi:putative transposase
MDKRFKSGKHVVYNLGYHIIWCPKYRRSVLTEEIAIRLKELLLEKSSEEGWEIVELEVMPDHVHIFVKVQPSDAPITIASRLKSYTSFKLRSEFPDLKKKLPTLWTRSFFVESVGCISEETIKKYIINQKGK